MKCFLDYKLNDSGKGKFLWRLILALQKRGVEVVYKGGDVALGISGWKKKPKIPRVLRVDGVYLSPDKKGKWRNEQIRKAIKASDAVIYQSKYAQKMAHKVLGIKLAKEYVIHNGANPDDYTRTPHEGKNVIMMASWGGSHERKSKRLREHLAVVSQMPDVHFFLLGETPWAVESQPNLTVTGRVSEKLVRQYLGLSDAMLYLAHPDWCPNAVVEAIVAGVPVMCRPGCGVEELVFCGGGVSSDNPVESLRLLLKHDIVAHKPSLWIDIVAMRYKKVFEHVRR